MGRSAIYLLVGLLVGAEERAWELPILVEEPIGLPREHTPVTGGICLPSGVFEPSAQFSLWDGPKELPVQVTPLVIDRAGKLRWILLDFQQTFSAGEKKELRLRAESSRAQHPSPLQVVEDPKYVDINTGPLRLRISRQEPFGLFSGIWVEGRQVIRGGQMDWEDARSGVRYTAGPPRQIQWEYRGPLRATLRVEGFYEGPGDARLQYITRITAWAGRSDLRVQHILANSNSQQIYHVKIKRAALRLEHLLGPELKLYLASGEKPVAVGPGNRAWLHQGKLPRHFGQPISDASRAGLDEQILWQGAESQGWLLAHGNHSRLWICDRDFLGDPPRRLSADPNQISLEYVCEKLPGNQGAPFLSDALWLYDLSHRTAEVWIDFDPPEPKQNIKDFFDRQALAARERLLAFAPGSWYAKCDVFGVGPFGTLEDEIAVYRQWGWQFTEKQLPRSQPQPHLFVRWEDNHYESEADSPEGLVLMAIRTGQRGFFDQAEAWGRYHANLHAWRTDGWMYDDGAIWFPQGGPLGTRPARRPANLEYQKWGKGSPDDAQLWHLVQAKSCYCHFYGAGLIDLFLITGERDFLEAAIDLAEQKRSEFLKHRQLQPGKTTIDDTRGFGRGFYVLVHLAEVLPKLPWLQELVRLCRDVLWQCPNLDERGFAPCHIGSGFGGFDLKRDLPPEMKAYMDSRGISIDQQGWLTDKSGRRWPVVCLGGTWQHFYVQAAAERYARLFDDEDMADFTVAFGQFAAKFLLSRQCKQTHYYTYMDVPEKGRAWDPWEFVPPHNQTKNGQGCEHSGWYTRFFPDAMAKAYTLTGHQPLLEQARLFWHYGSKRAYRSLKMSADWNQVAQFAGHIPPKDDTVLSTARMFYHWAHPRSDTQPPEPIRDLQVRPLGQGKIEVRFTAPKDPGGGRVVRYQLKYAKLPMVEYAQYDFARDDGKKRNFWRAANLVGEPTPQPSGRPERFILSLPKEAMGSEKLYFCLVSYDQQNNQSPLSNVAEALVAP
ncbi:MAG: hypothetical protein NZ602_13970 [Thermoguttaceae bacterium]|nr:hypothetical protein [Thermoguttaceae bacterium]MDW8039426.1 hypothetical protein [Thermoguttaceae bacterium]